MKVPGNETHDEISRVVLPVAPGQLGLPQNSFHPPNIVRINGCKLDKPIHYRHYFGKGARQNTVMAAEPPIISREIAET
jgi:hypothetical protein